MAYRESMIIRASATRREKYYMHNSLLAIPLMLMNKPVLIDLRNETSVAGRIVDVDGYMNVNLQEVVYVDQKGLQYEFESFMIPARQLRQIHIPDTIQVLPELKKFLNAIGTKKKMDKPGRSVKAQKAKEKHLKTVEGMIKN